MRLWKLFGFVAIAGLAVSCKSPVYVQRDETVNLRDYHTYAWVETEASQDDNSRRSPAYSDMSVRKAINAELARQGWRQVRNDPDVLLSYDILVERSTALQSDPVYSQPFTRWYYNPYRRRWGTIYYPSQFMGYQNYDVPVREGTITVTMTDPRNDKLVWQAWTTERLNYSRMTSDEIAKSIRNIFNKFDMAMR